MFFIFPGCKCSLNELIIISDLNVQLVTNIIDYGWSWDCISLNNFEITFLTPHLIMMESAGLKRLTLQDLQALKLEASRSHGWLALYT
jgi:hypothetical protein